MAPALIYVFTQYVIIYTIFMAKNISTGNFEKKNQYIPQSLRKFLISKSVTALMTNLMLLVSVIQVKWQ